MLKIYGINSKATTKIVKQRTIANKPKKGDEMEFFKA